MTIPAWKSPTSTATKPICPKCRGSGTIVRTNGPRSCAAGAAPVERGAEVIQKTTKPKPAQMPVIEENIPDLVRSCDQFVNWNWEWSERRARRQAPASQTGTARARPIPRRGAALKMLSRRIARASLPVLDFVSPREPDLSASISTTVASPPPAKSASSATHNRRAHDIHRGKPVRSRCTPCRKRQPAQWLEVDHDRGLEFYDAAEGRWAVARTSMLDEVGDLHVPPGSRPWIVAVTRCAGAPFTAFGWT